MRRLRAVAAAALTLASASTAAVAQKPSDHPASHGVGLQLYLLASSGWTLRQTDSIDNTVIDLGVGSGGGVGANLIYDLAHWIGGYAGLEFAVESEGIYRTYGAGVILRTRPRGAFRLHGRAGARIIDVETSLFYADLGVGAELFVTSALAVSAEASVEVPLGSRTRYTGLHTVRLTAREGPKRLSLGAAWYPSR